MSYTITTVTRRFYKIKVKVKPVPGRMKLQVNRNDTFVNRAKSIPVPPLFQRSSLLPGPLAARVRWRWNWKWVALTVILTVPLLVAIYALGRISAPAKKRSPETQQTAARASREINMHPMGYSSDRHSAVGEALQAGAGPSRGKLEPRSAGGTERQAFAGGERPVPAYSSVIDDGNRAMFDGRSKLVLPTDVSGACNVGEGGSKDLMTCLAQNGARAE